MGRAEDSFVFGCRFCLEASEEVETEEDEGLPIIVEVGLDGEMARLWWVGCRSGD